MNCNLLVMAGLVGFVLFVTPGFFYVYERWHKMPRHWCVQKTIMLTIGLAVCLGLMWPAITGMTFLVCHW